MAKTILVQWFETRVLKQKKKKTGTKLNAITFGCSLWTTPENKHRTIGQSQKENEVLTPVKSKNITYFVQI